MAQKRSAKKRRLVPKTVLRLPDLDQAKAAVLHSLTSADAQRAGITAGKIFRRVKRMGHVWGKRLTEKVVWHIVKEFAAKAGVDRLAPHDLRRTCAQLCHAAGGELDQIQFLLGHVSVQTTERYLGCKQRIRDAGNDRIGIGSKRNQNTPA